MLKSFLSSLRVVFDFVIETSKKDVYSTIIISYIFTECTFLHFLLQPFIGDTGIPGLWTQELDAGLWTLDSGCLTLDAGLWTLDSGLWMLDSGRWTLDAGCWTLDSGLWTLDAGLWTGRWTLDARLWTLDATLRKLGTGY